MSRQSFVYSACVPIHFMYTCTLVTPKWYLHIILKLLPAISKTTRSLPFPSKSAEPKVFVISPGTLQSAIFMNVSHNLKEVLLLGCWTAKSSIDFRLISLIFIVADVKIKKVHKLWSFYAIDEQTLLTAMHFVGGFAVKPSLLRREGTRNSEYKVPRRPRNDTGMSMFWFKNKHRMTVREGGYVLFEKQT